MTPCDRIARLYVQLNEMEPVIWRRVEVSLSLSLKALHDVIQAMMLFENYHLFEFEAGGRQYDAPGPEGAYGRKTYAARNVRIAALVDRGVSTFTYTYDFGDYWQHTIKIEAANPALEYPCFLDGEHRAPPEDVGGKSGFTEFLKAMARPRHPQHRQFTRWYGGPFDPADISVDVVQDRIAKLAHRRTLGKVGFAKSRNQQH
ncbi:plasmid pRiA4b ORF-3 family protein [Rhizobium rhizogenes]|uniref:plasmid pRiA4b ORF-3 family protein n=1 Tax=Rhizobium rhizogenes TaxID=359 RepID=UPI0022B5F0AF|nr:plasmid pRiA4b ORF-3 family protein [Rhizobium rhizogenes]MCZ7448319.1 plasmid pRiA4b ORF-3 family protein [Rhizobium rhizogenes]MCZ7465749.1 plasmid pRiA4b ORF-3 family protein [Rhizobium rhizogenes]